MSDTAVKLVAGRPQRGTFPVSLMRGDEVLIAGRVNPHKAQDMDTFIKDACGQYPALSADDLRAELWQLAAPRSAKPAASDDVPYLATNTGILWRKPIREGEILIPLTNFTAKIVADVVRDDGTERETAFEIEAIQGERAVRFIIPAARFGGMNWPTEFLGAEAIVYPGTTVKDHARVAVQMLSPKPIPRRTIYTHTGWRKIGDGWACPTLVLPQTFGHPVGASQPRPTDQTPVARACLLGERQASGVADCGRRLPCPGWAAWL